jgi:tetratricopeptide (TPR) repeat protein
MKKRICIFLFIMLTAAAILTGCGKGGDYKKAMSLYENGQFEEAAEKFTELGDYENSQDMVTVCRYEAARALFDAGKYEEAKKAFSELGDYENSANYVSECDYNSASALFEAGDYEGAIAIFESIPDFKDSQEKIRSANKELMIQKYGPVLQALNGKTWLFNGGSNTILNKISFTDEEAEIAQVSYDGNGKHDNGSSNYTFTVDDKKILITMADGSEMEIPYTLEGDSISLEKDKYFTMEEIDKGIQGYWNVRSTFRNLLGKNSSREHNIYFNDGKVISESATEATGGAPGEYYYYGPETGSYRLNFGVIDTEMRHGNNWFYNIIDGKVTILHYDKVCSPYDHLPGENGYNF